MVIRLGVGRKRRVREGVDFNGKRRGKERRLTKKQRERCRR